MKLIELEAVKKIYVQLKREYDPHRRYIPDEWADGVNQGIDAFEYEISELPIIEERKHGHWIELNPPDEQNNFIKCSVCGSRFGLYSQDNYCQNCGAKMDEQEANNENTL